MAVGKRPTSKRSPRTTTPRQGRITKGSRRRRSNPHTITVAGIHYVEIDHEYYKYRLEQPYSLGIKLFPDADISTTYIDISEFGELTIKRGYSWDGPSGPTIDTPDFMRGALVHDALYQLMRERKIGQGWRAYADTLLRELCLEDGMAKARADYVYAAVRVFGKFAAKPTVPATVIPTAAHD